MPTLGARSRILVARLDSIGDCVLSSAFFAGLRQLYPEAHITGVLSTTAAPLFARDPAFDSVLAAAPGPDAGWRGLIDPPYDVAICPRWDVDYWGTRQLALLSQAPIRIGFDRGDYAYDDARDGWTGAYFTDLVSAASEAHEVHKSWEMLRYLGLEGEGPAPRLVLAPEAEQEAAALLARGGRSRVAVLAAGAGSPSRVWPRENFVPVIDALGDALQVSFVVVGGADVAETGAWLARMRPDRVRNVAGQLSLQVSAALVAKSAVYIGMDTGLMHVAAASAVPVVEISCHPRGGDPRHRNSPERFGPFTSRRRVLQPPPLSPCDAFCGIAHSPHCITAVAPQDVAAAAADLLAASG